jgi:hypothetical protein
MGMCFSSKSVKHSVCHASNGLHSRASLGCSSFLCAGIPRRAITVFARPASKSAASFSSLGCRHLRACTGVLPNKAPLLPVRVTARIHVVLGLCGILAAACCDMIQPHPSLPPIPARDARCRVAVCSRCCCLVIFIAAAAIVLLQSLLPMARRGYVRPSSCSSGSRYGHAMYPLIRGRDTASIRSLPL